MGLVSAVFNVAFTLDRIPPPASVLDAAPSSTDIRTLAVGGSKEADASVWLNGRQIRASDSTNHWTYTKAARTPTVGAPCQGAYVLWIGASRVPKPSRCPPSGRHEKARRVGTRRAGVPIMRYLC